MKDIYAKTKRAFVILIDEWDCLFREYQQDQDSQKKYLDFLRAWLKDKEYVALAYMTGILPIKKYGSHSALNMFTEYSMTDPGELAEYFGFTGQKKWHSSVRNMRWILTKQRHGMMDMGLSHTGSPGISIIPCTARNLL